MKHTTGHWEAFQLDNGMCVIKEEGLMEKGYSDRIAELHEYPQSQFANAKLMAAAPEMLEALKKCLNLLEGKSEGMEEYLKQIIKKATV